MLKYGATYLYLDSALSNIRLLSSNSSSSNISRYASLRELRVELARLVVGACVSHLVRLWLGGGLLVSKNPLPDRSWYLPGS
jgi:hypothetical protein